MKTSNQYALDIIKITNRDLHFAVDNHSLLHNPVKDSLDIHIKLDSKTQNFYYNFFDHTCRQIQLLTALGDHLGAKNVLTSTKNELSRIVEKATLSKHHIVFVIPNLEACLQLNCVEE